MYFFLPSSRGLSGLGHAVHHPSQCRDSAGLASTCLRLVLRLPFRSGHFWLELLKRMQVVIDDLLTPRGFDGCGGGHDDPNGCGDTRGQSLRSYGSYDRRSRKQASSCGRRVEFCLSRGPGTSLRCAARHNLRGLRIGEAAHPGPPKLRILLDSASQWSQVPIAIPVEEGSARMVRSPGIWLSFEVMSWPRESSPRLEASGQNHTFCGRA